MSRRDPYLRAAGLILRHLTKPGSKSDAVDQAAHDLVYVQGELERTFQLLRKARTHGWLAAAASKRSQLLAEACEVQRKVAYFIQSQRGKHSNPRPQSMSDVHADLLQLEDEFDSIDLRLKEGIIAVETDSITLKSIELGPFSIELHLKRLNRRSSSSFECIALEPNPAGCNDAITHPHVSDKLLCAGDATSPLSAALTEGRIADAFCLMNAVLRAYNPGSAYVSLENWAGIHCEDCEGLTNSDDLNFCQDCERHCCGDCTHACGGCDETFCSNCLERDNEADEYVCSKCRRVCRACDRVVGVNQYDEETGLCPECLQSRQDKQNESTPEDLPEESHEQAETQTAPSSMAGAG